jgi:hypothetical protein
MAVLSLAPPATAQVPVEAFQGEAVEAFLAEARIRGMADMSSGSQPPRRATLERDGETHDAIFKDVEYLRRGVTRLSSGTTIYNMEENWRFEIAAYRVDRLVGLGMVPATVPREYRGSEGAMQWGTDGAITETERARRGVQPPDPEAWSHQLYKMWLFDNLVDSWDRHANNMLVTDDLSLRLIDHSRAFLPSQELRRPEELTTFSRSLLDGLRRLTRESLRAQVGDYLEGSKIDALLARRDAILQLAEKLVAERGEEAVLYP